MSTTTAESGLVPADHRLVVLFEHCDEPGSTDSLGFIVDTAAAYEWDGGRLYVHDEQGMFSVFDGVREALVLETALLRSPDGRFYQPDVVIEPTC